MTDALVLEDLTKVFAKPAVDHLSLTVRAGELYALLGPNGAGKTTTLRMVAGLLKPTAGSIRVFGVDALADPAGAKQLIAWAPDEPMLYDRLTPMEYLEFVAGLWGVEPKAARARAEELLKFLGLWDERGQRCESFSRGMKQKAALAGALIHDPRMLILDEPLTGLDAAIARQVKDLLQARVRDGATVILTTHILEVAERMADRIGIIKAGRLLAEGTLTELRQLAGEREGTLEDVFLELTGELTGEAAAGPTAVEAARVIGPPGSTIWLLSHEMRLAWRGFFGGKQGGRRTVGLIIVGVVFLVVAFPLAWAIRGLDPPVNTLTILIADAAATMIFSLMLSQTLAGAADALYARGDLDLLFSSPLDPRKTLTVRFSALAATAFSAFALLALPFLVPMAIFGHWQWLALLPTLAALALAASAVGLALAVALFATIGPKRTRTVAQLLAALIGAAFFLVSQSQTLFGSRTTTILARIIATASDPRLRLPPLADWPLRAALGQPLPLISLLAVSAALFLAVTAWLSRRFAADAAAAQGSDVGQRRDAGAGLGAFAGGAFAVTFQKEVRILRRDIGLLAQVLLRTLYLLPATFLVLRNAGQHASLALPFGAAVITFLAGQVAGTLTWLTLSAEEAPELIACAPAPPSAVRNAKLAAGLAPLVAILIIPLTVLSWLAPAAGLAAMLGAGSAAIAAGLINAWYPTPGKRSEFRRRRSGSVLTGLTLVFVSLLIGAAAALVAAVSPFALIPAALAAAVLLVMRRSPAKIADALAARE